MPKLGILLDALNEIPNLTMHYDSEGNPDWGKLIEQEFVSDVLTPCAIAFTGVCGVSWGFSAGAGAGGRTSLELYVDQSGETGLFWTFGGGAYVPFSLGQVETSKLAVIGMNNASVDDMKAWSAQLGAAGKVGLGFQAEWIVAKNSENDPMHGLAVGSSTGAGLDIHCTMTHTWRFR